MRKSIEFEDSWHEKRRMCAKEARVIPHCLSLLDVEWNQTETNSMQFRHPRQTHAALQSVVHLSYEDVLWSSMVRHVPKSSSVPPLTYRDASRHSRLQCCGRSGCDASALDLGHWWPSPWICHVETTIVLPWPWAPVIKDLWNIPMVSRILCWGLGDVFLNLRQLKWCGLVFVLDFIWSRIELGHGSLGIN